MGGEDLLGWIVVVEPVCAGHCDGTGGEFEEFVHVLEDRAVRVEGEDALILGLVEGEEFGEGICPCF